MKHLRPVLLFAVGFVALFLISGCEKKDSKATADNSGSKTEKSSSSDLGEVKRFSVDDGSSTPNESESTNNPASNADSNSTSSKTENGKSARVTTPETKKTSSDNVAKSNPGKSKKATVTQPDTKTVPNSQSEPKIKLSTFVPVEGDRLDLPSGGPNALMDFLAEINQNLGQLQQSQKLTKSLFIKFQDARLRASEMLMTMDLNSQTRVSVVGVKFEALEYLTDLGIEQAEAESEKFADQLVTDKDEAVADFGMVFKLGQLFRKFVGDKGDGDDEKRKVFFAEFDRLTKLRKNSAFVYTKTNEMRQVLYQRSVNEGTDLTRGDALRSLEILANNFASSSNNQLAKNAVWQADQLYLGRKNFDRTIRELNLLRNQVDEETQKRIIGNLMVSIREVMTDRKDLSRTIFDDIMLSANLLSGLHKYDDAKQVYEMVSKAFENHPDKELKTQVLATTQNGIKRCELIGEKIKFRGMKLTGKPMKWEDFEGNVVLVLFWATENQASIQVLSIFDKFMQQNQDKKIKMLAVNVDPNPASVIKMFRGRTSPYWTSIMSDDPNKFGLASPMATMCGVDNLPFTLLVDQNGVVADINVFGTDMENQVSELLGEKVTPTMVDPSQFKKRQNASGKGAPKDSKSKAANEKAGNAKSSESKADKSKADKSKADDAKKADADKKSEAKK